MMNTIEDVTRFYNRAYKNNGLNAQRQYPNEELCRFMGRNFFQIPYNERSNIKILETGFGVGANLWMIAKEGFDTYGIDNSEEALGLCKQMLEKYNVDANLSVQNMRDMNFPHNTFEVLVDIFSSVCLNRADGDAYLNQVLNILKPGGLFFSYFPSKRSDAYQFHDPATLIDSDTLNSISREDSPYRGNISFRFIHPQEYAMLLTRKGFQIQYLETVNRTYQRGTEVFEFVVVEAKKVI